MEVKDCLSVYQIYKIAEIHSYIIDMRLRYDYSPFFSFVDTNEKDLYWINFDGDIKSSKDDSSNVTIIHSINVAGNYYAIGVVGSYIYYADYNQLLMISTTSGSTPIFLYSDTEEILDILVFKSPGMFMPFIIMYIYIIHTYMRLLE